MANAAKQQEPGEYEAELVSNVVSTDPTRPHLCTPFGVELNGRGYVAACDGHRLHATACEAWGRYARGDAPPAQHVLSTDGVAAWPAGVYTAERESNLANTTELHRADALIGQLRKLWAVRVLDSWADREHPRQAGYTPFECGQTYRQVVIADGRRTYHDGVTRDAARIAAAKALVAEDPTLEPQELP